MGLQTLSPSRAGDFKACPQLFKFRAIDRLPEPVSVYQARGTTAHRALQRLFDLPAPERTPEALYDLFRAAWAEARVTEEYEGLFASLEEERAWGLHSLAILANYFSVEDPASFDPLEREMDLLEDLDGITIRGILDRMEERPDGTLVISDYKTGKAPPEQYALPAFFALKIYALLIRRRMGRTPGRVRLIYLGGPDGPVVYEIPVTDAQLDAMDRQLRALWTAINRAMALEDFPPRPGPLCDWCSFRDLCPAWAVPAAVEPPAAHPVVAAAETGRLFGGPAA
jgi:putative RecB family exonuclease